MTLSNFMHPPRPVSRFTSFAKTCAVLALILATSLHAENEGEWYPFTGYGDIPAGSVWRMHEWLDAPAGGRGRVRVEGERLLVGERPIKLWGVNLAYAECAPDANLADRRANFYAALGINAVRLHKYAEGGGWAGVLSPGETTRFDAAALGRMDYFVAALKRRGIYVKLSPVFIIRPGIADRERLPFYDEFGPPRDDRIDPGHGALYLSTELQDLLADQAKALLTHRNPHTGLTYAEDPAVAFFELYNEDSALFFGLSEAMARSAKLRARGAEAFFRWLSTRYADEGALARAWGPDALNCGMIAHLKLPTDESWAGRRIYPAGNPWFFDPEQLAGSQAALAPRLRDTMLFLQSLQDATYARLAAAVREAGYAGEIIASNWQAGRMASHYLNLQSDARFGAVDRHNYFGGGEFKAGGRVRAAAMVSRPGGGILSSGMQQVAGHPFMLSEWIHVLPTEWGAEGPALVGAYGMGLQGWDASFAFQNRDPGGFLDKIGGAPWEVAAPQFLGMFPAVSRQVLRGDVTESPAKHARQVDLPAMLSGRAGFNERLSQEHDIKTMESDVLPQEGLALVRALVSFGGATGDNRPLDTKPFWRDGLWVASTGELRWRPGENTRDGHVEIDSRGTQAVVGFASGRTIRLRDVSITPLSRFAAIYVTALSPRGAVSGDRLLVTALARARNSGQKMEGDERMVAVGSAPVRLEPVSARLEFHRSIRVTRLDHLGALASEATKAADGVLRLETGRDATPYYLVEYD